jgi:hypothetical protein
MFMPVKEAHFFDSRYDEGVDWYQALFATAPEHAVVGEFTPNYLTHKLAIARLAETVPHAQLIVAFREPVERAQSEYKLYQGEGVIASDITFEEAMDQYSFLREHGRYAEHLRLTYQHFDPARVHVCLYDDIENSPANVIRHLYAWLGVDADYRPLALLRRYNVSSNLECRVTQRIRTSPLWMRLRHSGPATWLKRHMQSRRRSSLTQTACYPRFKRLFRNDVLELQAIIGRDLSHWL